MMNSAVSADGQISHEDIDMLSKLDSTSNSLVDSSNRLSNSEAMSIDMAAINDASDRSSHVTRLADETTTTAANNNNNNDEGNGGDSDDENDEQDDDDFDALFETDTKTPGEILDEFCVKLKDINTTLPDSVINHYMRKSGFIVNDPKLVKIISIASQKFISEIVNDVMQHHKLRTKATGIAAGAAASASATSAQAVAQGNSGVAQTSATSSAGATSAAGKSKATSISAAAAAATAATAAANAAANSAQPLTLTLEDLSQVLTEYGINVKKPYYFM